VLAAAYEPRTTAGTVLQQVVRTHLERFLAEVAAATDEAGVPRFIEREFRAFLSCGSLSRGFARVHRDLVDVVPTHGTMRVFALRPYHPSARRVYQPGTSPGYG
jgi:hypothetical protein